MKRLLSLVSALFLSFVCTGAYASLGWSPTVNDAPVQNADVRITVKALEYSGTSVDFDQSGLNNATVWKEITGRVNKDTLVKFPIRIRIPSPAQSGLTIEDHSNASVTVQLKNALILDIVAEDGSSVSEQFQINTTKNSAGLQLSQAPEGELAFTVLAIVASTAETRCSVNFTMGQSIKNDGTPIRFGVYTASWINGESLTVSDASGNRIHFQLNRDNRFGSNIFFTHSALSEEMQQVGYCMNGELEFGGKCACTGSMEKLLYQQISRDFNAILKALGFSFSYGNFQTAYCTEAGLRSLTRQVNAVGSVVIGSGIGSTIIPDGTVIQKPGHVDIPQTGSSSLGGIGLLLLASSLFAFKRKLF